MEKINFSLVAKKAKSDMLEIFISCVQFHHEVLLPTNVKVFCEDWDERNSIVTNNANAKKLNHFLRKIIYEIETIEFSFEDGVSINRLREIYLSKSTPEDFYSVISNSLAERNIRQSTMKNHENTFTLLKNYASTCQTSDLTEVFTRGFYESLVALKYKGSTINKHMEIFRCYYNLAIKMYGDKIPKNSFSWYRYKNYDNSVKSLSSDEVRLLEIHSSKTNSKIIDQFLFMCYTGMRFSDFISMQPSNFTTISGKIWLDYISVKTSTHVKIPLYAIFNGKAELLLYKYINNSSDFFKPEDNSFWNRKLNIAVKGSDVTKHLSAHVARHTFACILLDSGVSLSTIQKVIGHRNLNTTLRYAKVSDDSLVRQLTSRK